jgi:hypothetical protein
VNRIASRQADLNAVLCEAAADDGDVLGFLNMLAAPLQQTTKGAKPPGVISVSYGECEPTVAPYTAGGNAIFGGSCCTAAAGYDLASGLGSPLANQVAALLPGR